MAALTPQQALDLALQHHRDGRLGEAEVLYRRLLAVDPHNADLHHLLGLVAHQSGALDQAVYLIHQAIALNPGSAYFHSNLGNVLQDRGTFVEAVASYRRALELAPDFAAAHNNLGNALKSLGRPEEAVASYHRALQLDPQFAEAGSNLADVLHDQGQLDEAISTYRQTIGLPGDLAGIHNNYLATLQYWSQTTPRQLLEAHESYDRRYAQPWRASWQPHANSRDPRRPLRLGFVSPHFCFHPVGRFLIRLLENLDRREFEVVCFADRAVSDAMTSRLRACAANWQSVENDSDEHLARRIREARIDILFDLAGHTAGNRLLVFARKPAPIQITWLDYVGTTGLSAMDYILADPREIPPEADPFYREKVLRLPDDYICFDPPDAAPPVGPLPAAANGFVTLASFNIVPKTTPQIVEAWGRILRQIPNARLILKNQGFDAPAVSARLRRLLTDQGVNPDRVLLRGWASPVELLGSYNEVDIGLDTFPYNGGLTTCEALWMGVPVVTCVGETFAGRHGLTHLTAAGVTETIGRSLDEYVHIAVSLAHEIPRLSALRATLRERVAASPLCDGPRFAGNFAALMRQVWQRWCADAL